MAMLVVWVENNKVSPVATLSTEREYSLIIPFLSACGGGDQETEIDLEPVTVAMTVWGDDEGAERKK